jgi:hypothetical protein
VFGDAEREFIEMSLAADRAGEPQALSLRSIFAEPSSGGWSW